MLTLLAARAEKTQVPQSFLFFFLIKELNIYF